MFLNSLAHWGKATGSAVFLFFSAGFLLALFLANWTFRFFLYRLARYDRDSSGGGVKEIYLETFPLIFSS